MSSPYLSSDFERAASHQVSELVVFPEDVQDEIGEGPVLQRHIVFGVEILRVDEQIWAFLFAEGLEASQLFAFDVGVRLQEAANVFACLFRVLERGCLKLFPNLRDQDIELTHFRTRRRHRDNHYQQL